MHRRTLDRLLRTLARDLAAGPLAAEALAARMTEAARGTDAQGAWSWRGAHDVAQAAAILADRAAPREPDPFARLAALEAAALARPTETRRSERQVRLQQFSTPLPYAFVAATAGAIRRGDVALEPSAGTGALAAMAEAAGARVALNEIDPFRARLLEIVFDARPTQVDAEHIDDLLGAGLAPSVVLMNPPFASSVSREGDPTLALRHAISAAKRLAPGGRLVAILPRAACAERQGVLWRRLTGIVAPRLHLGLPGLVFRKMGTSVDTALLVADRVEAEGAGPVEGAPAVPLEPVPSLDAALRRVLADLPPRAGARTAPAPARSPARPSGPRRPAPAPHPVPPRPAPPRPATIGAAVVPLAYAERATPGENAAVSDLYARYAPQRIAIAGALEHPTPLVESLAMAAVAPPMPSARPLLPARLVSEGLLSAAQLETIVMADDAHARDLPGRFRVSEDWTEAKPAPTTDGMGGRAGAEAAGTAFRQGYFLGDGTGAGKGRQVAGLILSGWLAGRTRAIWLSKSRTLIEDARRDWADLGGAPTDIQPLDRWKPDQPITLSRGVLFATYATLRAVGRKGTTRLEQIAAWAGAGFDGILAFDEAHAMANAAGSKEGRGSAPSQQGVAGLRLQRALPRARVLYVSATGATQVANLAYATRLGLWGPGDAYPFASREAFVAAMEAGGVAAMEVVARDLKALGLYTARALSFDGVEYDVLEHRLSEDERAVYDGFARAFRVIHKNLHKALAATGIVDEVAGITASAARASALSRFEGLKQRFFGHVLGSMKARTLIAATEADLAEGWAPVVQLVSTGESHLGRALEGLEAGDDLTEGHLTPKEVVVHWLSTAFPVEAHRLIEVDGVVVSELLRDADGRPVVSREALALREAALLEVYATAPLPSALDRLVWHFGEARLAEVTGRSKRTLRTAGGALKVAPRSASANAAESAAFQAGTKTVLVFSDAGGTGRSYHAVSGSGASARRRRHYLVEPGWRADAAIQGLGRTHRSGQITAPFFRVLTTDVQGERRFTSTIARRLDTLGALTRGQRQAGSQALFRASDNLEGPLARRALVAHLAELAGDRCEAMPYATFEDWTALRLLASDGALLDELPPIQRYLNRLLALPIAMQDALFAALAEKIEAQTEAARAAGTLDLGIETLRADRVRVVAEDDLWTCPRSGSVTRAVTLETETALHVPSAQAALAAWGGRLGPMRNAASGKAALLSRRAFQVMDDDTLVWMRELRRPTGRASLTEDEFAASRWEPVGEETFAALWDAEADALPKVRRETLCLLTGLLLPIWSLIPSDNERIWRVLPEGRPSLIGRGLSPEQALVLRGRLGGGAPDTPEALVAAALAGEGAVELGRGLTLRARCVAGARRLEIEGARPDAIACLKAAGCFTEIIAHQLRVFVPAGDGAAGVLAAIRAGGAAVAAA